MKRARARYIAGGMLLVSAITVHAEVYRCVDTEGNVIFSQKSCDPAQESEKINLNGMNTNKKPKPEVCGEVKKLAELIFPHVATTNSILDMYTDLGGREHLSAGVTAAVNYIYSYHYNPKAKQTEVVDLTHSKCLEGGFGMITQKDLPVWDNIKYIKDKPKEEEEVKKQKMKQEKVCKEYDKKINELKERMVNAKDKSEELQSRVDKEYYEEQKRNKCSETIKK